MLYSTELEAEPPSEQNCLRRTGKEDLNMTPEEIINRISEEVKAGKKIQAIKILRQATGLGLREAKAL
ncbi:MAG: ribosomal protein L7/L12 [Rhodothermales bacterium]|jgi:ribosomal protein L7/L12